MLNKTIKIILSTVIIFTSLNIPAIKINAKEPEEIPSDNLQNDTDGTNNENDVPIDTDLDDADDDLSKDPIIEIKDQQEIVDQDEVINDQIETLQTIVQTFPDTNMASAVAQKLSKNVDDLITQQDIENATDWSIGFSSKGIKDITGIEHFINLKRFSMENNQISKLPINFMQLTSLEYLSLKGNQLSSIPDDINKLTKLKTINIDNNHLRRLPSSLQ